MSTTQPYFEDSVQEALLILDDAQAASRAGVMNQTELEAAIDFAVQKLRPVPTPTHDAEALEQLAKKHPIDLPWMQEGSAVEEVAVDILLIKRALKALSFQERLSLCDEVGVHFAFLEAVLQQPGAQQSSLTAPVFSQLVQLAAVRHESVAQVLNGVEQNKPMVAVASGNGNPTKCSPLSCDGCPTCQ